MRTTVPETSHAKKVDSSHVLVMELAISMHVQTSCVNWEIPAAVLPLKNKLSKVSDKKISQSQRYP